MEIRIWKLGKWTCGIHSSHLRINFRGDLWRLEHFDDNSWGLFYINLEDGIKKYRDIVYDEDHNYLFDDSKENALMRSYDILVKYYIKLSIKFSKEKIYENN